MSFLVKPSPCSMSRIREKFLTGINVLCQRYCFFSIIRPEPELSDEEVKEEMMRCFSLIPMRRQAIEMMRTMCQEDDEQMGQYIVIYFFSKLSGAKIFQLWTQPVVIIISSWAKLHELRPLL